MLCLVFLGLVELATATEFILLPLYIFTSVQYVQCSGTAAHPYELLKLIKQIFKIKSQTRVRLMYVSCLKRATKKATKKTGLTNVIFRC